MVHILQWIGKSNQDATNNVTMKRNIIRKSVIVIIVLLVINVPIVQAQSYGTLVDGFEDGDKTEWTVGNNDDWSVTQNNPRSGSWSLEFNDDGSTARSDLYLDTFGSANNISFWINYSNLPNNEDAFEYGIYGDEDMIRAGFDGSNFVEANSNDVIYNNIQINTWYLVRFENIDCSAKTYNISLYNSNENLLATQAYTSPASSTCGDFTMRFPSSDGSTANSFDDLSKNGKVLNTVSGYVKNPEGDKLENANVTFNNSIIEEVQTNSNGFYSTNLESDTYTYYAERVGYEKSENKSITVSGDISNLNITLEKDSQYINLNIKNHFKRNESQGYEVIVQGQDRTSSATTTSDNTTVLEIFQSNATAKSGSKIGIANVTATYDVDGTTVQDTETVLVYDNTLEDISVILTSNASNHVKGGNILIVVFLDLGYGALFLACFISALVCKKANQDDYVCIGISIFGVIFVWILGLVPNYIPIMAMLGLGLLIFGDS